MFNPSPRIERLDFGQGLSCLLVDDALQDPEALRNFAIGQRQAFVQAPFNAYPGVELALHGEIEHALGEFFDRHVRGLLGGRRRLRMNCRLAMTTTPPAQLLPRQWIPHRDSAWIDPRHLAGASVLYLFADAALGGTNFYFPRKDAAATDQLVHDSSTLDAAAFTAKHGLHAGYAAGGNACFELVGSAPARWNRMIFYDGRQFHSGAIDGAASLVGDPLHGRLTLNGFFTCSRRAA
jgi:hypothetical protein